MNDFSLIEKINILIKLISSSPLFFAFSIIGVLFLIVLIFCIIKNKKLNKWIIIVIFTVIGLLLLINYGKILINVLDIIIDWVFMALYFPSLPTYICVLLITNTFCILSIFNKKQTKITKIINLITSIILDFFLFIIIDVVSNNNINIYEEINLYTNSSLLVLLELSMGIFVSWILINLILSAHNKLKKYDEKEYPMIPEIIFDWV